MTHYVVVTMKRNWSVKPLVILGVGYAVWSEINRRIQDEKIHRLATKLDELMRGEGE